jgi:nitrogen fixation protein FixH
MKVLVIIVTVIGLSAVAGSIIVGILVFDGKVVEHPYETGLIYDETERTKSEIKLEILNRGFHKGENQIVFTIKDRNNMPIIQDSKFKIQDSKSQQIKLVISRPSTTRYNREVPLVYVAEGKYRADVVFPLQGLWDLELKLMRNGKPVSLEKRVYVGE